MFNVYAVTQNENLTDGYGEDKVKYVFATATDSILASQVTDGLDGTFDGTRFSENLEERSGVYIERFVVYESIEESPVAERIQEARDNDKQRELAEMRRTKLIRSALQKLTCEEKDALGL